MATSTAHFNLIKPSVTDNVSVNDLNTNFENIDTIMYANQQSVGKHDYSETEQVVGTWIDGKPIYEKTINLGYLPNATILQVTHGITNLKNVIDFNGCAYNGNVFMLLPFVNNDALANQVMITIDATNIVVKADTDRSAFNGYATLRYTKTTD